MSDTVKKAGMNLYTSFNRLKNQALDLTCVYETLELATTYVTREYSKAYEGQVIAVWGDATDGNNGVYCVGKTSEKKLYLIKSANASDLETLKTEIKNEIKPQLESLSDEIDKLRTDFDTLEDKLSDELLGKITKNEEAIAALRADYQADVAELEQKIADIYGGDDIDKTLDTIKEIADWIKNHEDVVKAFAELSNAVNDIKEDIKTINSNISAHEEKLGEISNSITGINSSISDLQTKDKELGERISNVISNIDGHYVSAIEAGTDNAVKIEDCVIDSIEIELTTAIRGPFNCYVVSDAENTAAEIGTLVISSVDETDEQTDNEYSLIDISQPGRTLYTLSYPVSGVYYIRWSASDAENAVVGTIRITTSKANNLISLNN